MGLSLKKMFSGKGWKKFKKAIGGVAKIAIGALPGVGGVVGSAASKLLQAKKVKDVKGVLDKLGGASKLLNISKRGGPVWLPGGALSTPNGPTVVAPVLRMPEMAPAALAAPRKRRKPSVKRATSSRRRKSTSSRRRKSTSSSAYRRKTKGRLPKFGSPAWRKRFLSKRKRKAA